MSTSSRNSWARLPERCLDCQLLWRLRKYPASDLELLRLTKLKSTDRNIFVNARIRGVMHVALLRMGTTVTFRAWTRRRTCSGTLSCSNASNRGQRHRGFISLTPTRHTPFHFHLSEPYFSLQICSLDPTVLRNSPGRLLSHLYISHSLIQVSGMYCSYCHAREQGQALSRSPAASCRPRFNSEKPLRVQKEHSAVSLILYNMTLLQYL